MARHAIWSVLILLSSVATAGAGTIDVAVTDLPATYTPGSTISFQVGISGAVDLNSYNLGLDLTSTSGSAGTDFYFLGSSGTPGTTPATAGSYIFSPQQSVTPYGFAATADTLPSTNTALLTLSDFLTSGGTVTDASPYTELATVVVGTTPQAGDLSLSFDGSSLQLLTPSEQPVPGSSELAGNLSSFNPPVVTAVVPEPATYVLLLVALGLLYAAYAWRGAPDRKAAEPPGGEQSILAYRSHCPDPRAPIRRAA